MRSTDGRTFNRAAASDRAFVELPVSNSRAVRGVRGPSEQVRPLLTGRFETLLESRCGVRELDRGVVTTLQVNVGKLCNQACHHCHVDAGPKRTEIMTERTARRVLSILERSPRVEVLDITGGAPELCPSFPLLVRRAAELGKKIIVRCNLTVLFEPGMEHLPDLYCDHRVQVVASLPCYLEENVDRQRGAGVFDRSIAALQLLNRLGYGEDGGDLELHLVYNPLGASLPPAQESLEAAYKKELWERHGIRFNRLFTITNMPISRFAEQLAREGKTREYLDLLVRSFNPETLPQLMCRSIVSIGWEGEVFDCDFNQMLEHPSEAAGRPHRFAPLSIWDFDDLGELEGGRIRTADHCLGCTAGSGSSCTGAIA